MREIIKTELIEKTTTTFVAEDGKIFNNEIDCKNHETKKYIKERGLI